MSETSASLLDRLRAAPADADWRRLVDLYTPLVHSWLRRQEVPAADADDVVQEVLAVVVRKLAGFERERTGSFRRWLRSVTVNCLRERCRAGRRQPAGTGGTGFLQVLDQLEDPASELSRQWDREHDRHVTQRLLEHLKPRFEATTWKAFQRVALDGLPAAQAAAELGLSVNAVFIARSRVMTLLRQEGKGLLD
jgi:RNA polymerase sigma-70 factor, ECF subfamily